LRVAAIVQPTGFFFFFVFSEEVGLLSVMLGHCLLRVLTPLIPEGVKLVITEQFCAQ